MRTCFLFLSLLLPAIASGADSLTLAEQLYQNGAPRLALARVVRDQPQAADVPAWTEWESLRLELLAQLNQPAELIERLKLLPANAPKSLLQKAYGHAAWAHLERNEGAAARAYLARLLWQFMLAPADQQWARRLVIRSYLVEHKPDEAYRAMLRYQQDFAPLPRDVAQEFVQGMLAEDRATEAMTWLADLDPASALALRLQLKVGLVTPEAASAQARSAIKSRPAAASDYAGIVMDVAKQSGDAKRYIDILEQQLAVAPKPGEVATDLWRAYVAQGEAAGNRLQLLRGDDASWLAMAAGVSATDPQEGRAVYAYLAARPAAADTREAALSRLFASLSAAQPESAVRLFAAAPWSERKNSLALIDGMVLRVEQGMPAAEMRPLWLAASRFAATQQRFDLAADYCVQAVLVSDLRVMDALATEALKGTLENMERAGFRDDAVAFARRVEALRAAAKKQPAGTKRKK